METALNYEAIHPVIAIRSIVDGGHSLSSIDRLALDEAAKAASAAVFGRGESMEHYLGRCQTMYLEKTSTELRSILPQVFSGIRKEYQEWVNRHRANHKNQ
jgi:hypothetical protein